MNTHIAFNEHTCIAEGSLLDIALAAREQLSTANNSLVLIFELDTGRQIDIDTRGTEAELRSRFGYDPGESPTPTSKAKGQRGRPKLGVTGREVTLLPRHWDWLDTQRGGASATLRRLVDEARKENAQEDKARASQDKTLRFMSAIAGDLAGYEDATRALYSQNRDAFEQNIKTWPKDICRVITSLCEDAF